ncbi:MAG: SIR2 family protein [Phycisphaerales bacterium]|nr:SIR2 family protein [Phycisphaerales bacterium]
MPPDPAPVAAPDAREQTYRSLVEAIAGGAVLFVGAGSSRKVGYPMWDGLLAELEAAARKVDEPKVKEVDGVDSLLRASTYKTVLGPGEYQRILRETFAPRTPPHDAAHEALVAMPFRHVLTTNYDGVLQSAHHKAHGTMASSLDADEWDKLSELRQRQSAIGAARSYVHLHGSIERPQSIVLCKEEYDQRYHHEQRYTAFLREFLVGQRLVFVGFSLTDEAFKYILREVEGSLQPSGPRHFAILAAPADANAERIEATNLRRLQGIEPVYFDNAAGDFSGLWTLIGKLRADVDAHRAKNGLVPAAALQQLVTELLGSDPDLQKAALQRLPGLVSKHSVAVSVSDAGAGSATDVDREIDGVFKLVARGLPDDAIAEYEAIRIREGAKLTAKLRYRLDANIGNALYSKGETELASKAYLRAASHYRDSRDAKGIELLGTFLAGDLVETKRLAAELCTIEPTYGRAWSIWVRTHEKDSDFGAIEAAVPDEVRKDPEVAQALAELAARCGQFDAQVRYARAAVAASPEWEDAHSMLGAAIITSERRFTTIHADRGRVPEHPDLIAEAESSISKAIHALNSRDAAGRLAGLHFNRSVARRLLGREADATADLREAFRRDPTEPVIVLGFAMEAEARPDMDAAIAALSALPPNEEVADQVQFATVMLRLRRRAEGDIEAARAQVEQLCARLVSVEPATHRADIVRMALRVCYEQGRSRDGPGIVNGLAGGALSEHQRSALLARAYLQVGSREEATRIAEKAIRAVGDGASWFDRREAAQLAQDCGLHSEAVRLWRTVIPPNDAGSDTVHLVRAAYFAGDWRTVLDVCATVRAAGGMTRRHLEAEVEVLAASREVGRAIGLLKDWVSSHPNDKHAVLHLSLLAVRDGSLDLAVFDESRLPAVPEVLHPGEGAALVFVLRRGPAPGRSLEVAYALYRRFPEHPDSHRALVSCELDPSANPLTIERHQRVSDGAAVYVRRHDEQPHWVYIESAPDPVTSRGEFPSTHEFVKAMWGRAKGDKFDYLGHQYEILGTENRILRRIHDIMERYEETFPDKPMFRRFSAPSAPPPDAPIEEKLGEIYGELKRQESNRKLLESMYRENRIPIATFAAMLGRRVFDLVRYLASDRTMGVRADDGDAARWPQALAVVRDCTELVLDGTVLAGALVLDVLAALPKLGIKLIVPQAVLDELRELSLEAGSSRRPQGTVGLHHGKLFFLEPSPEEIALEVARIESVIQFVRSHCEVVGGAATLDLPKELKDKLEEFLDATSTDAVALAIKRRAPLWTDDLGLQRLLTELDCGVRTVWTQAVMRATMDRSRISEESYEQMLGRLLDRGYAFTRLSASEMVAVLRHANWRTDRGPGEELIRVVCAVALMNPHNQFITALFMKGVWTECPRREWAKAIIVAVLEKIGRERSQTMLAAFIYRFRGVKRAGVDRKSWVVGSAGTEDGSRWARRILYTLNPFGDRDGRALKRFLRSWRSRDAEFKPRRTRGTPCSSLTLATVLISHGGGPAGAETA